MPVPLLLLPVLQNHGDTEYENGVDPAAPKGGGEDLIEVLVGEAGELADATTLLGGDEGIETGGILNKGRGGGVEVAAAVELGRSVLV